MRYREAAETGPVAITIKSWCLIRRLKAGTLKGINCIQLRHSASLDILGNLCIRPRQWLRRQAFHSIEKKKKKKKAPNEKHWL
jgi:hypothetical protein